MIRKILISLFLLSLLYSHSQAQQLLGIANSNYAGTNGIYINPSSIADSRHGFYLNFFTFEGILTNNYISYNGPVSIPNLAANGSELKESYLEEKLNGRPKMFTTGFDFRLPSVMLKLSPKHSIAFTTRSRNFLQANNVSEDISSMIKAGMDEASLQNVLRTDNHFGFNANSFAEVGFTYARTIFSQDKNFLKGGITVKRLAGLYSAHIINKDFDFEVKEDAAGDPYLRVQNLNVNYGYSRGEFNIESNDIVNAVTFRDAPGRGYGADIGFTYERRPDIEEYKYTMDGKERLDNRKNKYKYRIGVALMDIGNITYNDSRYVRSYAIQRQNINISTEQFQNANSDNMDEIFNEVLSVQPSERKTSFKSGLPTALNINFDYKIANKLYVNTTIVQGLRGKSTVAMRQNSMIGITPRLEMKWLEIAFPLSLMNNYSNFAFGSMVKLGPFFVGSDNIAGALNWGKPFGADVYAGMALPIFKGKKKDKDKDGVSNGRDKCKTVPGEWNFKGCPDSDGDSIQDSEDKCPTEAGLKEFGGCPDKDSDGIQDSEDRCPDQAGLKQYNGCPDTDGDNIIDSEDECPAEAGLIQFKGCPDTDGDGVADKDDKCPDVKGLPALNGCPDKDNDGVTDSEDRCPEQAGSKEAKGCPDSDKDGIVDPDDACPDKAGSAQLKGCPDRDMDGVPDHKDNCPDTFGSAENNGCPLVKVVEQVQSIQLTQEEAKLLKEAFDDLEFENGKAVVAQHSLQSLEELAELLIQKKDYRLLVSGHTDNIGKPAANLKLSQDRAMAIKKYLVSQGVSPDQVITEGFGSTRPVASNSTPAGRQKNRRVEMKVIK